MTTNSAERRELSLGELDQTSGGFLIMGAVALGTLAIAAGKAGVFDSIDPISLAKQAANQQHPH